MIHRPIKKHPHGRGEDCREQRLNAQQEETPPRAWGRPIRSGRAVLPERNTPTGVGKTKAVTRSRRCTRKHPHGRGEDSGESLAPVSRLETPPRAWGRLSPLAVYVPPVGNTPTGVGKTGICLPLVHIVSKHPHGRGEDPCPASRVLRRAETPPRAWGRLVQETLHVVRVGNTPTGVGKTQELKKNKKTAKETPPRAWGRQCCADAAPAVLGNTPTGVGKTRAG